MHPRSRVLITAHCGSAWWVVWEGQVEICLPYLIEKIQNLQFSKEEYAAPLSHEPLAARKLAVWSFVSRPIAMKEVREDFLRKSSQKAAWEQRYGEAEIAARWFEENE